MPHPLAGPLALSIGFLKPIYEAIGWLLAFFYGLVPNLGVSIVLLTFVIMALLFPLTAKQARSMIAMQKAQPEIKKLQAKYKHDRQKLNEELMAFYKEHKINPLAGCLPLVVQMPIFIALYEVILNAYKWVPQSSDLYAALCGGSNVSESACSGNQATLTFLGLDLSKSATASHGSLWAAIPYFLLVLLVVGTGFLQSRQSQRTASNANPQMQMIAKVLPVVFGLISINLPSGLVLYFFVSNLWRLGQQEIILRRYHPDVSPRGRVIDVRGAATSGDAHPRRGLRALLRPAVAEPPPKGETREKGRQPTKGEGAKKAAPDARGDAAGGKGASAGGAKGSGTSGGSRRSSAGRKRRSSNKKRKR